MLGWKYVCLVRIRYSRQNKSKEEEKRQKRQTFGLRGLRTERSFLYG
jgi:hypothetical protein